ncbi:hypothetical protein LCGC14_1851250 [marine sediment metagenome]|uniref:Uncharacterized protein n=1 Tax=marine sediment metagenome TaxID=412755 RepID=A0A0F9IPY4_9ZZZZ
MPETEEGNISIRRLTDGEFGTPIRDVEGILENYFPEAGKYGTYVQFQLAKIDVKETTEPYNFPTCQLSIKLSNRNKSKWGILSASINKLISDDEDISSLTGKRIRMKITKGHLLPAKNAETGEFADLAQEAWEVIEVEGKTADMTAGTSNASEKAAEILNGKSKSEFNKAAYANSVVRADRDFQRSITDGSFLTAKLATGEFTKDENDIYHKVEGG